MELKPGYYWIEHEGKAEPCLFDGEHFHCHGNKHKDKQVLDSAPIVMPSACQNGCICTVNPDGSITVNCKPNT